MYLLPAYPRLWEKWRWSTGSWRLAAWADARAKGVGSTVSRKIDDFVPALRKKARFSLQSPIGKLPALLKALTTRCPGHGSKSIASATHNANAIVAHVTKRNKTMLYWRRNRPQKMILSHLLSAARWWGLATSSRNVAGGCRRSSNAGRTHLQPPDLQG